MKASLRRSRRKYETKLARVFVSGDVVDTIDPRRDRFTKLRELKEAITETLGFPVRFSKNAGCSMCACSPGFIATGPLRTLRATAEGISDNHYTHYYMDITQEEKN